MTQTPAHITTTTTTTTTTAKRRSRSRAKHSAATTSIFQTPPSPSATYTDQTSTQKLQSKNSNASTKKQPSTARSTSDTDAGSLNPYLNLVFRRMRRLKKRVTRVESTEAALTNDPSKKDTLEPGQLMALEKKLEMSAPLKELEGLFKAMTILQASDNLEHKKQIEEHSHDIEIVQETATKETQESAISAFIQVIRLFYALKQLDDAKEYLTMPLLSSLKALEKFRTRLFEVAQRAELSDGDDCAHSREELYSMVHKLTEKCADNVSEEGDITYKHIYDELDHLTYPSADLQLRDTPRVSDDRQVDDPSSIVKAHARVEDDGDGTSVRSLMSEPTLTAAQKSCATVENWFNKISPSNLLWSESPPKTTLGSEPKAITHSVNPKQAESTPVAQVSLGREVASQTDPVASIEPPSMPAAAPMPPTVVPLVPVHPIPNYRFMLPPWVGGSSYPADPHISNPSLSQAQQPLPIMRVSNEPGYPTFSQPEDKESGKRGSCRRFGRESSGHSREGSTFRSHRIPQDCYGQREGSGQLEVIYEDDEKEFSASSNITAQNHDQHVSYYSGSIYQESEQLQATDPNQSGTQGRMAARTMAESASSGVRRGVSPLSGDQLRQQQAAYDYSSGVMTLQQSESTSFGNKGSGTSNNKESLTDNNKECLTNNNNNGAFQGRWSGKKKGRGQDRSPSGQTQQGGPKSQNQRSIESSSSHLHLGARQQQHPVDNTGHYLQFQQHSASSRSYDHMRSDAQNKQYYRHKTQQQQQHQQQQQQKQQRRHEEQELSLPTQQQQQQDVHHYFQQPFYQYPGGWYYPGYGEGGGTPVYCVQSGQQEQQEQQGQQGEQVQQT
ncbi:hypothetical protein BG015_000376 [Linnemannia schmuckeri]|uniref:Uncharacterized protein n=1 Tax=Linnemannia schmuckeri TaxID=64567 RepID=A0A9P5RRK9_9FUNG|nr:hypothetical protein BG015_000376 [Linnemannia schmuckeri]